MTTPALQNGIRKGGSVSAQASRTVTAHNVVALAERDGFDLVAGFAPKEGHIYTVTRAISARVNQNFDGFPSSELKAAYKTFLGKPVFVNHANENPETARGRVVGARYVEAGTDKYIQVIQEVNAQKFPKLAKELEEGGLDSVSMGCVAARTLCSFCGNEATDMFDMCDHVLRFKGQYLGKRDDITGSFNDQLVYEECRGLGFFELSYVFDPADETAMLSNVMTASRQPIKSAFTTESGRVRCDFPGCKRWTVASVENDWHHAKGAAVNYDYCSKSHRSAFEAANPNWKVANLSKKAYGETEAPAPVDTMRDEDEETEYKQYVTSPPELSDPDLSKAEKTEHPDDSEAEDLHDADESDDKKEANMHKTARRTRTAGHDDWLIDDLHDIAQFSYDGMGDGKWVFMDIKRFGDRYELSIDYDNGSKDIFPIQANDIYGAVAAAESRVSRELGMDPFMYANKVASTKTADWTKTDFSKYDFEPDYDVFETTLASGYSATIKSPIAGRGIGSVSWGIYNSSGLSVTGGSADSIEDAMRKAEDAGMFYTLGKKSSREAGNGTTSAQEKMNRRSNTGGKDMGRSTRTRHADQSRNDQGEQEDAFVTQTPPAEPVETADGDEINNQGKDHVALYKRFRGFVAFQGGDLRTANAKTIRAWARAFTSSARVDIEALYPNLGRDLEAARVAATRRSASDDDEGPTGTKADDDAKADAKDSDDDSKKESRRNREARLIALARNRRRQAGEKPDFLKKDDSDDSDDSDDKDDDKKKESRRLTVADFRDCPVDGHHGSIEELLACQFCGELIDAGPAGVTSSRRRRVRSRRRQADSSLEVAAPDGRVDVERPTADTTDDEAQESQFDKGDFGDNAGDDIAKPDLSTDQNWAPGDGKKSSKVMHASTAQAVRLAEAYISSRIAAEGDKWNLVAQFEKTTKATVLDRIALLERISAAAPARAKTAGFSRGSDVRSAIPRGLMAAASPQAPREASSDTDPGNDFLLFG